jgi:hypothetical protein
MGGKSVSLWRGRMDGKGSDWISKFISKQWQHNIRIFDAKGSDAMTKKLVFHLPTDWKRGHWAIIIIVRKEVPSKLQLSPTSEGRGGKELLLPIKRGRQMRRGKDDGEHERGLFVVRCVGEHDFSHHNRGHQLK